MKRITLFAVAVLMLIVAVTPTPVAADTWHSTDEPGVRYRTEEGLSFNSFSFLLGSPYSHEKLYNVHYNVIQSDNSVTRGDVICRGGLTCATGESTSKARITEVMVNVSQR